MPHLKKRKGWRRYIPRGPKDINKREQMLMMLGLIWITIGFSTLASTSVRDLGLLHERIPQELRGCLWVVSGSMAVATAWRPRGYRDWLGWAVLYIMPTLRVISYFLSWIASVGWVGLSDWGFTEYYTEGWRFGIIYLAQSLTVVICSGWPNPIRPSQLVSSERGANGSG